MAEPGTAATQTLRGTPVGRPLPPDAPLPHGGATARPRHSQSADASSPAIYATSAPPGLSAPAGNRAVHMLAQTSPHPGPFAASRQTSRERRRRVGGPHAHRPAPRGASTQLNLSRHHGRHHAGAPTALIRRSWAAGAAQDQPKKQHERRRRLPGCCAEFDNPASSIGLLTGTNRRTIALQEACREDADHANLRSRTNGSNIDNPNSRVVAGAPRDGRGGACD